MFTPFYYDDNVWFGTVDSVEVWQQLVAAEVASTSSMTIRKLLDAQMAPVLEIDELPRNYHMGGMNVRSGKLRSFGYRREHTSNVKLGEWAKTRGMDLRKLAEKQLQA